MARDDPAADLLNRPAREPYASLATGGPTCPFLGSNSYPASDVVQICRAPLPGVGAALSPSAVTAPLEPQASDDAVKSYIERCLKPQREWFCKKATFAKRVHHVLITAQVLSTAAIPMINMLILQHTGFTYLSTAAAAVSGLTAGMAGLGKYREHWLRYRQSATMLENIELEYELSIAPYNGPDRNNLLINTVRKLLEDEQKLWLSDVKSTGATRSPPPVGVAPLVPQSFSHSKNNDDDS